MTEVRRLLAEGKAVEAEALADKAIIATPRRMPPYQPLGDLTLALHDARSQPTDYRRELDLDDGDRARHVTPSTAPRITREVFASAVDQAIVVRLTKSGPGRIELHRARSRASERRGAGRRSRTAS